MKSNIRGQRSLIWGYNNIMIKEKYQLGWSQLEQGLNKLKTSLQNIAAYKNSRPCSLSLKMFSNFPMQVYSHACLNMLAPRAGPILTLGPWFEIFLSGLLSNEHSDQISLVLDVLVSDKIIYWKGFIPYRQFPYTILYRIIIMWLWDMANTPGILTPRPYFEQPW